MSKTKPRSTGDTQSVRELVRSHPRELVQWHFCWALACCLLTSVLAYGILTLAESESHGLGERLLSDR